MPTKISIYDNIEQYSAQDLYKYISEGIIEFEELCRETAGYFPADVRKELKRLIEEGGPRQRVEAPEIPMELPPVAPSSPVVEESAPLFEETPAVPAPFNVWDEPEPEPDINFPPQYEYTPEPYGEDPWPGLDKTDIDAVRGFIAANPSHNMIREANKILNSLYMATHVVKDINSLKREVNDIMTNRNVLDKGSKIFATIEEYIDKEYITTAEFLNLLGRDNNFVSSFVVKRLIDAGYFTYPDLTRVGVNRKFIDYLIEREHEEVKFPIPKPISKINKVSTEIYFWGIPSSGKTCALGGILSMAKNGKFVRNMSPDNDCQGYGYMTRLADVFKENRAVGSLPPGTAIYDIWEMGFDLEDPDGRIHPITCVDLAGELVRCMYKNDAGELLTEDEMVTLDTITNLLISNRSTNRKMHFFVLEYGGEERLYEGLDQSTYLQAALAYIKRTKIFNRDTDGVFLLFTKVDKTNLRGPELVKHLIDYTNRHYANFYNGLTAICQDYEINGGKVERLPFTLGNVCFQNYCLFDGAAAENVVKLLLNRTKGFKKTKFQKFINKVKG